MDDHQQPVPSRRRFHQLALLGSSLAVAGTLPGCAGMNGPSGEAGAASAGASGAAARGADATPAGTDWLEIVKAEHRLVDAEFTKLLATTDRDTAERTRLRDRIASLLTEHAIEEENVLYPALAMAGQGPSAGELYREHAQVKVMLSELEVMPKDHPGWLQRARQLQQAVMQHVQTEETRIYPPMRQAMSAEQNAMVTRMYVREGRRYVEG